MHLSIASPIPPTWGIYRGLVGDLFEFRFPAGRAWWGIVLEVTAFIHLTNILTSPGVRPRVNTNQCALIIIITLK